MSIDFDTKPKITFSLPPLLAAYCRYVFKSPTKHNHIILRRNHDIGKLIWSHIQTGDFERNRPLVENPVTFILPNPGNDDWIRYRHLYVPRWVEQKFNDAIEYEFKWWVREKFRIGYDEGYDQKTIINAILTGLNERENIAKFDTIKKIDYRNRKTEEKKRFKKLCLAELERIA